MKNYIYPCLWFDGKAKEAAEFYCSVFNDSKIISDTPVVVTFESSGQRFSCLNGGPDFKVNPSISFYVTCFTEEEIQRYWDFLIEDGSVLMPLDKYEWTDKYGWLQDKYGVTWQLGLGKLEDTGQKFTPSLLFVNEQYGKAGEAIEFYTSVFRNSFVEGILRYDKNEEPDKEGAVKHAQIGLDGHKFMVMESNRGHKFSFNEAVSIIVACDNQEQIDYYWDKLTNDGGEEGQCGWLKDRFGVSWQIIPAILEDLMNDQDRSERVINAFLQMKKFEIDKLVHA
jgi:predicted 3-demethylubiquinone-9 3-methyltransferase (glyoxalase superfamily)